MHNQALPTSSRPPASLHGLRVFLTLEADSDRLLDEANTSYVERNNLSMRMGMRRFTRLTNAFSKRPEKHCAMLALYFHAYNWVKPHGAERTKANNRITPAMAAGLTDRPTTYEDSVALIDERAPAVNYARKYRKRKTAG